MLDGINNYPLTWPIGWKRTTSYRRENARFMARVNNTSRRHTVSEAITVIIEELRLLGATNPIISTNLQVRQDGLPRSGQRKPDDPGVAVYFMLKKQARVLACDRWTTVEDNLWAIGKHIEAMRGQERWGVGTIDQAFQGYPALPIPKTTWWEILGVSQDATSEEIHTAYRALCKVHHPDAGGTSDAFIRLQKAYQDGLSRDRTKNH